MTQYVLISAEGDIIQKWFGSISEEAVAEETPHLIFTEEVDPAVGLLPFQARRVAFNLGLSGLAFKEMVK